MMSLSIDSELLLAGMVLRQIEHFEKILLDGDHYHDEGKGVFIHGQVIPLAPYLGFFNPHPASTRQDLLDDEYPAFIDLLDELMESYPAPFWDELYERATDIKERYVHGYPRYIGDAKLMEAV